MEMDYKKILQNCLQIDPKCIKCPWNDDPRNNSKPCNYKYCDEDLYNLYTKGTPLPINYNKRSE